MASGIPRSLGIIGASVVVGAGAQTLKRLYQANQAGEVLDRRALASEAMYGGAWGAAIGGAIAFVTHPRPELPGQVMSPVSQRSIGGAPPVDGQVDRSVSAVIGRNKVASAVAGTLGVATVSVTGLITIPGLILYGAKNGW